MVRCLSCFNEVDEQYNICRYCGSTIMLPPKEVIHLKPGTVLEGRYLLGQAVGAGGFGIVYKAFDLKHNSVIAVKEFYASRIVTRAPGLPELIISKKAYDEFSYRKERFLVEAKNMARFGSHRSMPNVFDYFEANNTAYIVMELLNGVALNDYLREKKVIDIDFAVFITNEVGHALESLHSAGIIHRDVAPDNIFISMESDIRIKLMDLGGAKLAESSDDVIDIILKPGYTPTEQYENSKNIGPWSDIYALGATLYVMVTGVRPEESTNRRIEDTVMPPHEINPDIPVNLSNAIMKAMALDRHMRFKNIADFLNAINGKRKVFSLAQERKKRKMKQLIGITAALFILVGGGIGLLGYYMNLEKEATLSAADITVWYEADSGSSEIRAMESVIEDFSVKFPDVSIELVRYDHDSYTEALEEAGRNGSLPNLFESSGLSDSVLDSAADVSRVLKSNQADDCMFLENSYESYYGGAIKQVPLGYEIPVAIVITGGKASVDYSGSVFSNLNDFAGCLIAFDSEKTDLLSKSFEIGPYTEENFGGEDGVCAVLITTTARIQNFKQKLMGFKWHTSYCVGNSKGQFVYEWSVGEGSKEQKAASEKLLSWMLGNVYQNSLMVSLSQEGQLPINTNCFEQKTGQSNYYTGIVEANNSIIFEK